jgi:hypothetical protein
MYTIGNFSLIILLYYLLLLQALNRNFDLQACFLVHSDENFVNQFCDSVCVLQLFPILQLFLKLDKRKIRLAADTLAILCQVMRVSIQCRHSGSYFSVRNFSQGNNQETCLEKELIILGSNGNGESCDEFWRILTHSSTALKSRAIRI